MCKTLVTLLQLSSCFCVSTILTQVISNFWINSIKITFSISISRLVNIAGECHKSLNIINSRESHTVYPHLVPQQC